VAAKPINKNTDDFGIDFDNIDFDESPKAKKFIFDNNLLIFIEKVLILIIYLCYKKYQRKNKERNKNSKLILMIWMI